MLYHEALSISPHHIIVAESLGLDLESIRATESGVFTPARAIVLLKGEPTCIDKLIACLPHRKPLKRHAFEDEIRDFITGLSSSNPQLTGFQPKDLFDRGKQESIRLFVKRSCAIQRKHPQSLSWFLPSGVELSIGHHIEHQEDFDGRIFKATKWIPDEQYYGQREISAIVIGTAGELMHMNA